MHRKEVSRPKYFSLDVSNPEKSRNSYLLNYMTKLFQRCKLGLLGSKCKWNENNYKDNGKTLLEKNLFEKKCERGSQDISVIYGNPKSCEYPCSTLEVLQDHKSRLL